WGSGTTISPRHVLTPSHVINWTDGNQGGVAWITFTPPTSTEMDIRSRDVTGTGSRSTNRRTDSVRLRRTCYGGPHRRYRWLPRLPHIRRAMEWRQLLAVRR